MVASKDDKLGTYDYEFNAPREIANGIWWLPLCLRQVINGKPTHVHNAQYLIIGSEKTLLYDAGFPAQLPAIEAALDALLDGRELDFLVPSHPEVNHCSGTAPLLDKYPGAMVLGDIRDYALFWPNHADRLVHQPIGSLVDLGSHKFRFVDAVLKDLPSTQWGYEESEQVLFSADGFAYSHMPPVEDDDRPAHEPGECSLLATELPKAPQDDQIVWITKAALYWTRFVKIDRFKEQYEQMAAEYPIRLVAPAHGAIIDDPMILDLVWEGLGHAYSPSGSGVMAGTEGIEKPH